MELDYDASGQAGFTRTTQRMLTALRMLAYGLATLFMIVMVVRGVVLTRNEMEADGNRSIQSASAAMTAMLATGNVDPVQARTVLEPLAPTGVVLRIDKSPTASGTKPTSSKSRLEVRRIMLASGPWVLVATIDHTAIWRAAIRANLPFILLVGALGLPVIMIFLYMGWAVNRPALQLLSFAQGGANEGREPPKLPRIWNSVLARLKQLRDSQTQMQAFLDHAPIGMMFRDAAGKLVMINRYGASFYDVGADELATKPMSFFDAYFPDSALLAKPMFLDPLTKGESTTVETEFHGPSGERMKLLVKSFPVLNSAGTVDLVGNFFVDITDQRWAEAELDNSRAQLIAFFDNLPTSIYLKQVDHKVIYVSKHLAEQYGKRPEDMIGQHEYDLHVDAMKPILEMMDEQIMSTGNAVLLEGEHLQFNRQELVSRFPVFNDKGEITHIGGMNFDIDARAKAQAALQESKALFEAFIQHAPNPMVLIEPTGKYVMINDTAARYYGETPDALLAGGAQSINARFPEAKSVIMPMFARVAATREFEQVDTIFEMPSGELREMAFAFFPILGANGELAFIGNISYDLTEERRAQAALAKSSDALHQSEKLAALGSMLAGVSHELNNPLAAVIGQAALLAEDIEGTEHADRVSKIRRAADRCARIVQSFLAMARQKAPEYRSVSINDQVRSAVELTEYQMRAADVTLDLRLADNLPKIAADPDELHQVIANLLTNARQALEEVSGERRITLTTSREQDTIRLSVADTGRGIDSATRDRIFDPFFTTKAVGSGTGIGLSYSLGVIEAHGGTIRIEDADVGTVFVITLPVKDDALETVAPEQATATPAKGRALVIDDEEDVADTLCDMLVRQGLDVKVAIGGLAGQAAMAGGARFDIILSDIRMPDLDGPALYRWMTANRPELLGRIAFVTGDTLGDGASDFLRVNGCPVLEKPFSPAALRELVLTLLDRGAGELP